MEKRSVLILSFLVLLVLLSGCGLFKSGSSLRGGACYWINQHRYDLPATPGKTLSSALATKSGEVLKSKMFEGFDGDIYIASGNQGPKAFYWKNGEEIYLSGDWTVANDIFVNGTDVYVAGQYRAPDVNPDESTEYHACYWENNQPVDLGPGLANSIFVKDSVVYIAGIYFEDPLDINTYQACYWVDDQRTVLNGFRATGIFVENTDIYISGEVNLGFDDTGSYETQGCYWRNDVRFDLDNSFTTGIYAKDGVAYTCGWGNKNTNDVARSIFVAGNDIYVAGSFDRQINPSGWYQSACYWKNGELFPITSIEYQGNTIITDFGELADIFVSGDDVFMIGRLATMDGPMYSGLWINGQFLNAASDNNAVFVTRP